MWTRKERKKFDRYLELGNELYSLPAEMLPEHERQIQEYLYLEAKLLVWNKPVIGYLKGKAVGVYSFREGLEEEEKCILKKEFFLFVPAH